MKLKARVNDQEHDLVLTNTDRILTIEIDGRAYTLEVRHPEDNSYLLVNNTRLFDCRVERARNSHDTFNVSLNTHSLAVSIINPKRLRIDQNSDHQHHGTAEILAPMPGKVVRVLVEEGQTD